MELITQLKETKKQTLGYFDLPDSMLTKSYGDNKWNVRQLLNHLTDAETVLYDRIRRVIAKPNQVIWGFDQEAWAENLHYETFPLPINKKVFSSVRDATIYLAEEYYESCGHHEFVHNETGTRTLKDEFKKVAEHNQHHLDQISRALVN